MLAVSAWTAGAGAATWPHPAPAVAAGHQFVERQGHRPDPAPAAVRPEIRAGELRAERVHPVLVDAADGLLGGSGVPARAVGAVAGCTPGSPWSRCACCTGRRSWRCSHRGTPVPVRRAGPADRAGRRAAHGGLRHLDPRQRGQGGAAQSGGGGRGAGRGGGLVAGGRPGRTCSGSGCPRATSGRRGCSAAGRRGARRGPVSQPRMAGKPCNRVAAGRDHPREAMPAGRACAQIAGPELKELRWQQTRSTH